jgi:hypothetical protein
MLKFVSVVGATATMVVALGAPALADPAQEAAVPLQCGDTTLTVAVAPANGTFTPNFDTDSTSVFKPTLLQITKTVRDSQGQQISSDTVTDVLGQGKQAQRSDAVTCTASQTLPGDWVGLPSNETLLISVNATGYFTPRHG